MYSNRVGPLIGQPDLRLSPPHPLNLREGGGRGWLVLLHNKLLRPHKLRAPAPLTDPPALPLRWVEEGGGRGGEPEAQVEIVSNIVSLTF